MYLASFFSPWTHEMSVHTELIVGHLRHHLTKSTRLTVRGKHKPTIHGNNLEADKMYCDAGFSVRSEHVLELKMGIKHASLLM